MSEQSTEAGSAADTAKGKGADVPATVADEHHTGAASSVELDTILDIPVTLSIELGRTRMSIEKLLKLNEGSIIELERPVDQPMDVLVNGTLVAHGEVVLVDETLGIRLTDVVTPMERVKKLR